MGFIINPYMVAAAGTPFVNTYSVDFDGVNDYAITSSFPSLTGDASISFWMNLGANSSYRGLVSSKNYYTVGIDNNFALQLVNGNSLRLVMANGTSTDMQTWTPTISTSTWYHVVLVLDTSANTATCYFDGVAEASILSTTKTWADISTGFLIATFFLYGSYYSSGHVNGKFDEVSIFSSALSAANVTTIYNSGTPTDLSSLSPVGWWRMGDGDTYPMLNDEQSYSNRSVDFDGVTAYVDTGMTIEDMLGSSSNDIFTLSFWIKHTSDSAYNGIFGATTSTGWNDGMGAFTYVTGVLRLFINNYNGGTLGAKVDTSALTDGQWYHILMCYDADLGSASDTKNLIVFVDGVEAGDDNRGSSTTNGEITGRTNTIALGRLTSDSYNLLGNLDEVAFWATDKRADVATIYNSGEPADLTSLSPVAWWRMGEGDTFNMLNNEQAYSNRSVDFDGINDYVTMGDVLDEDGTGAFSISAWVKLASSGDQQIAGKMIDSGTYAGYGFYLTGDKLRFSLINNWASNALSIEVSSTFVYDVWTHVCVTYDGSQNVSGAALYVNGSAPATTTVYDVLSSTTTTTAAFSIGSRNDNSLYAEGNIDEVAVFSSELTSGNVTTIYNSGVPNDISGLSPVGWWRMGEGDTYPTLTDSGSGSNDGTMTNMAADDITGAQTTGIMENMASDDITGAQTTGIMENMVSGDIVADVP